MSAQLFNIHTLVLVRNDTVKLKLTDSHDFYLPRLFLFQKTDFRLSKNKRHWHTLPSHATGVYGCENESVLEAGKDCM